MNFTIQKNVAEIKSVIFHICHYSRPLIVSPSRKLSSSWGPVLLKFRSKALLLGNSTSGRPGRSRTKVVRSGRVPGAIR